MDLLRRARRTSGCGLCLHKSRARSTAPVILHDPDADEDGDGQSNRDEDIAGTNPLDTASFFRIASLDRGASSVTLTWQTVPDRSYTVERSNTLLPGSWSALESGLTAGTFTDTNPGTDPAFYRIRVHRPAGASASTGS